MKSLKYAIPKFVAEFILIIGSIILSFYFQGKIDEGNARKEASDILTQIRTDLVNDTINYRQEIDKANRLMALSVYLMNMDYDKELVTESDFDSTMFLIGETTNNLYTAIHLAGYTRLINFEEKEVIKDYVLIDSVIGYYTLYKTRIDGYYEMDRDYVDRIMVEKYLENDCYNVLNTYYSRNILGAPYDKEIKLYVKEFLDNKKIRSLLIFNIINKRNYMLAILSNKACAQRVMGMIDDWNEKRKK